MALTIGRWLAAFVAGSLFLVSLGMKIPDAFDGEYAWPDSPYRTLRRADRTAKITAGLLRTSIVVDSAKRALARVPATDSSRWLVSPGFSTRQVEAIRRLHGYSRLFRVGPSTHAIDVVFIHDVPGLVRGVQAQQPPQAILLPERAGDRCVVIERVEQSPYAGWLSSREFASHLLGPCAYYEAYGHPGPQIDRWLRGGAWRLGRVSSGDHSPGLWHPPSWMNTVRWEAEGGHPLREYVPLNSVTCIAGDARACDALLRSSDALQPIRLRSGNAWTIESFGVNSGTEVLGPRGPYLLSEMAREIGPERFKRFWTSTAEPAQAFRDATGQELGQWTADWAHRMYGDTRVGPAIPVGQAALSIVIVALGAVAAMLVARRRQMTT